MGIFFGWLLFSIVVGAIGSGRKIGFWGAFLLSLLLSPIIGIIITLVSKNKEDEEYKKKLLRAPQNQQETLHKLSSQKNSVVDELEKLKKLKEENLISEDEFQNIKNKIINS